MPLWNQFTWNSPGALWNSAGGSAAATRTPTKKPTMKRRPYYPRQLAEQGPWLSNFADKLGDYETALGLSTAQVEGGVQDALYLKYALAQWLKDVRTFAEAATQAVDVLSNGTSDAAYLLPAFTAPTLPAADATATPPLPATIPVRAGALRRIFDLVQIIKRSPGYNLSIGQDMAILGDELSAEPTRPVLTFRAEGMGAGGCQCVKVRIKRYRHYAVALHSRRGGGAWELLGIVASALYEDERPLLVPGQPEVREYRARFWDAGSENGDLTDTASVTVSP